MFEVNNFHRAVLPEIAQSTICARPGLDETGSKTTRSAQQAGQQMHEKEDQLAAEGPRGG